MPSYVSTKKEQDHGENGIGCRRKRYRWQCNCQSLLKEGWSVYGLSRKPGTQEGITPVAADLQDAAGTAKALTDVRPDAVFITTWARQDSEAENIRVNSAMVRNLLDGLSPAQSTRHVALVTGLKHYLGPFEAYGKGTLPQTPFREEQGRLDVENFYYAQEDEVFAAAKRDGFSWSVHRPHTVIGQAVGNAMNMGTTLAVYATICRETGRPFRFPGSAAQWNSLTDMTDANLLAKQLLWAAETPEAKNEAFNVVNGDVFRWSWMWGRIADWFGIEPAPFWTARSFRSKNKWNTIPKFGIKLPYAKIWPSRTLPVSHRHGIPTPIWAARSRSSPTWAKAAVWASRNISQRMTLSLPCSKR